MFIGLRGSLALALAMALVLALAVLFVRDSGGAAESQLVGGPVFVSGDDAEDHCEIYERTRYPADETGAGASIAAISVNHPIISFAGSISAIIAAVMVGTTESASHALTLVGPHLEWAGAY